MTQHEYRMIPRVLSSKNKPRPGERALLWSRERMDWEVAKISDVTFTILTMYSHWHPMPPAPPKG